MELIYIPKKLMEEARRRGIDVIELVLNTLTNVLNLDPHEITIARLEIAEKFLKEAKTYLKKKDVIQASEKLYKVVEECIKSLAEIFKVSQLEEVRRRGKWTTWLLGMASTDLSKQLNEDRIALVWSRAYDIHIWGFHEAKYRIEDIEITIPLVEWLLNYTRQVVEKKLKSKTLNSLSSH